MRNGDAIVGVCVDVEQTVQMDGVCIEWWVPSRDAEVAPRLPDRQERAAIPEADMPATTTIAVHLCDTPTSISSRSWKPSEINQEAPAVSAVLHLLTSKQCHDSLLA